MIKKVLKMHLCQNHEITCAENMSTALEALRSGERYDLVLLDLGLPDTSDAQDSFNRVYGSYQDVPIIILTSKADHELAVGLVDEGAADYVKKDKISSDPERICDAIDFAICRHKHTVEEKQQTERAVKEKEAMMEWVRGGYSVSN